MWWIWRRAQLQREAEAMMEAQAQAAALIDTLQGDMHTCGRCQEIVLEVNMAPTGNIR